MRLLIFGGTGNLGSEVLRCARAAGHDVDAPDRGECNFLWGYPEKKVDWADAVINCAGVIRRKMANVSLSELFRVNTMAPWDLASMGNRLIHISSDSVFSGVGLVAPTVEAIPDPRDLYDRSKLAGEPMLPNVTVVRTAFVDRDHGLLKDMAERVAAGEKVPGYVNDIFRGCHTSLVAGAIVNMAANPPGGIQHLCMNYSISKYDLLKAAFGAEHVEMTQGPVSTNRALLPTIVLPRLDEWSHLLRAPALATA